MSNYFALNITVNIPLTQEKHGYHWELELIHKNRVYYWTNDTMEDIALVYEIYNEEIEPLYYGENAYEMLYHDVINITQGEKPKYMSESFKETLKTLI